jgi:hypothetical protein
MKMLKYFYIALIVFGLLSLIWHIYEFEEVAFGSVVRLASSILFIIMGIVFLIQDKNKDVT